MKALDIVDADETLRRAYLGLAEPGRWIVVNHFGAAVDLILASERTGEDPLRAALHVIYGYHQRVNSTLNQRFHDLMKLPAPPPGFLPGKVGP